jgi:pimeloyl-ACP methyl ester carboxylesterase
MISRACIMDEMIAKTNLLSQKRIDVGSYMVDVCSSDTHVSRQSIIFVHGIGVSGRYFLPFANELAKTYHVVVVDLPGYGKTPKPAHALSIIELADFIINFTKQLKLEGSVILGHSMGSQIVAHAVKQQPQLYSKVILLAPTVYAKERSLFMQSLRLLQDSLYEPIKASTVIFPDYLRMGIGRYLTTCRYMLEDRIEETLVHCPNATLIMRGTNDKIVPEEWAVYLDRVTPNSMLRHVHNAPHALQLGQPSIIATMCRNFIEG